MMQGAKTYPAERVMWGGPIMAKSIESLVASQNEKATRIGWLTWNIIGAKLTEVPIVKVAFRQSGLPEMYDLPDIRPVDAYRRASKSIEGRVETPDPDEKVDLLVRDVFRSQHEVVRYLVVEHRNTSGRQLDYDAKAAMLRFDHDNRMVDVAVYSADPYVQQAVDRFLANYHTFLTTYDDSAIRRVVRSVLIDVSATALKESGSVYLVPRHEEELLFQLNAFINALPNCKAYKMSVEDTEDSRDMVRDLVTNKATAVLSELRATMKADITTDATIQEMLEKAKRMKKEIVSYQQILQESLGTFEADVELLEAQMLNLIEKL